jgi:tRNA modification GTPase
MFLFENSKDEIDKKLIEMAKDKNIVFVRTKADLSDSNNDPEIISTSAKTGFGIDKLKAKLSDIVSSIIPDDTDYTTNLRQQTCLINAKNCLLNLLETAKTDDNPDLFSYDLKQSILALGEITGEVLTDSILDNIFSAFCIGK